jgi:hypothetical protein
MISSRVGLLEDQIGFHVLDPRRKPGSEQAIAADGLVETIKSYPKWSIARTRRRAAAECDSPYTLLQEQFHFESARFW